MRHILLEDSKRIPTLIRDDPSPLEISEHQNRHEAWNCAYYDNAQGNGPSLASLTMQHLASDWQEEPGWGYEGPPILNNIKSGFYLKCNTRRRLQRGNFKMIPFVRCDYLQILVDKKEIYFNKQHVNRFEGEGDLVDLEALHFDSPKSYEIEVTVGVLKPKRSWVMFSISRIYPHARSNQNDQLLEQSFSYQEKIACGVTPDCNGPATKCHIRDKNGLEKGEQPWGLCLDFVPRKCLVYSFGIRDIYKAELLYGRHGCEVHAFDCTIAHPERLGPNVTFHPWCLGSNSSELKLDGSRSAEIMALAKSGEFLELPSIQAPRTRII